MPQISSEEFLNLYRTGKRNFRRVQLQDKAELQGVTLCEVDLTYTSLLRVNLCQADLHGSKLIGAVLIQADLSEADLRTADLSRANLCEANLQGANLCEANLQGVNLCEANLQDALYNQQTQFPPDFDPSLAGMSLCVEQSQPPSPSPTPKSSPPSSSPSSPSPTPKSSLPSTPQATRFLRLLRKGDSKENQIFPLFPTKEVFIGRDPHCKIVLDSRLYSNVSRHHAVLRPFLSEPGVITWEIWDLNSANGTYVNGQRIKENLCLQVGDRITLGHDGPQFIFQSKGDLNSSQLNQSQPTHPQSPKSSQPQPSDSVNLTQLFPIISMGRDLPEKAYLLPMIITVIFVVLMFTKVGDPDPTDFNRILGIYLGGVAYYFVYKLCGRRKPWWVLLSTALATILILNSPLWSLFVLVFRQILPGDVPESSKSVGFFSLLIGHFFGAGLMEELLKALPVLGAYILGSNSHFEKKKEKCSLLKIENKT